MSRQSRANARTAFAAVGVIVGMLGLTAAAVPLYDLFCRVTGYGGTTQRAEAAPDQVREETIKVRFNADIAPDLPWAFAPEQREMVVHIGEQHLAFYRAENRSRRALVGSATFNVTPHQAGRYFSKIACFCFEEQTLAPGEVIDMPVSFFVDPEILKHPNARDIRSITLSYTFFKLREADGAVADTRREAEPAS